MYLNYSDNWSKGTVSCAIVELVAEKIMLGGLTYLDGLTHQCTQYARWSKREGNAMSQGDKHTKVALGEEDGGSR